MSRKESTIPRHRRNAALAAATVTALLLTGAEVASAEPQAQTAVVAVSDFTAVAPPVAFDYAQRARDYDAYVYDWSDRGVYTTISDDASHLNTAGPAFKMPSYYGDARVQPGSTGDGDQEAVTEIASVVGASLVGIDKSGQSCDKPGASSCDYVDMLRTFYNPQLGVARNTPSTAATAPGSQSIWYTTTANVLYYMLGELYPQATDMDAMLRSIADSYLGMVDASGGASADLTMQDFDWADGTKIAGTRNEGGEAAAGAAAILLWAHSKFGDARYLTGAEEAMDYLQRSTSDLFYEVLPILAPYLAARLNAETGSDYDVSKYLSWLMAGSGTRSGWGTIDAANGTWGSAAPKSVAGLIGSRSDSGGYVFAMNSFAAPLVAATAKYDPRYADAIGQWMQRVYESARYFYADQLPAAQQYYGSDYADDPAHVIAYEGIMKTGPEGIQARGDIPERSSKWGVGSDARSLGLYGSSWVGFLGSTVTATSTPGVLRTDLDRLDFFGANDDPTFLYYNAEATAQTVVVPLDGERLLYDAVTDTVLDPAASGSATLTIPARSSVVLVEAPAHSVVTHLGGGTQLDGVPAGYDRMPTRDVARSASAQATGTSAGAAADAIDGDDGTGWSTSGTGRLELDLGTARRLSSVTIAWGPRPPASATVEASTDGTSWTTLASGPVTGTRERIDVAPTTARRLRVTATARPGASATVLSLSAADSDLALDAPVTVSSTQNAINVPGNLTDGSDATRWESATSDPQWAQLDLGSVRPVGAVQLAWETAAASRYTVSVSPDGQSWTTVATVDDGVSGQTRTVALPAATSGRFVRVTGTARATKYAYSLYRLSVYAPAAVTFSGTPQQDEDPGSTPPPPTTTPDPPATGPGSGTTGPGTTAPAPAPGATQPPVKKKVPSRLRTRLSRSRIARGAKLTVHITVSARPHLSRRGSLVVRDRGRVVAHLVVPASGKVATSIRLTTARRHRLTLSYAGNSQLAKSTASLVVTVTAKKK